MLARMPSEPPFDPAAQLTFSTRPDARARRRVPRSLSITWMLVAIAGLLVFIGLVRAMTERTSVTAGPSVPVPVEHKQINTLPVDDDTSIETTWRAAPNLVYKCVGANGVPSYQSVPCGQQDAPSAVYDAAPDSSGTIARARALQRERIRQSRAVSRMSQPRGGWNAQYGGTDARDRERVNCEAARAHRARTLALVGLSRTHDLLRELDRQVYEACKGLQP